MIEFHQYEGVICQVHSRQSFEILGTIILIFFQLCHLQKTTTIIMKYIKKIFQNFGLNILLIYSIPSCQISAII